MNEDLFTRIFGSFGRGGKAFFSWFFYHVRTDWIRTAVLVVSATQTYNLLRFFAPSWAFWLPPAGVGLMEMSTWFWWWRETTADAILKKETNELVDTQERIANAMIWTCLGMSGITMVAGALIEISGSNLASILHPNPQVTAFMGWAAIVGVFLLGVIEVVADWQYRRADPMLQLEREHRAEERELFRRRRSSELKAKNSVLNHENSTLDNLYTRHSRTIGRRRARQQFREQNTDVFGKRRKPAHARKVRKAAKKK